MKAIVGSNCVAGTPLKICMFLYLCSAVCCWAGDVEMQIARPMKMDANRRMVLLALSDLTLRLCGFARESFSRKGAKKNQVLLARRGSDRSAFGTRITKSR